MEKKVLQKNYLAAILGMRFAEWVLTIFTYGFYLIFPLLRVYLQRVEYDNQRVYINKGILNKTHEVLELYKLQDISADSNIFGYGKISFVLKTKRIEVRYIKRPADAISEMLDLKDEAQRSRNVSAHEVF